jgi:hypothetical protein
VHALQRGVQDVVGGIVVDDGTVEPFTAVHPERVPGLDMHLGGNLRVPPVVADDLLVGELLRRIEREDDLGHCSSWCQVWGSLGWARPLGALWSVDWYGDELVCWQRVFDDGGSTLSR